MLLRRPVERVSKRALTGTSRWKCIAPGTNGLRLDILTIENDTKQSRYPSIKVTPLTVTQSLSKKGSSTRRVGAIGRSPGTILLHPWLHHWDHKALGRTKKRHPASPRTCTRILPPWCPGVLGASTARGSNSTSCSFSRRRRKGRASDPFHGACAPV